MSLNYLTNILNNFCVLVIVRYRDSKVSTIGPLSSRNSQFSREINGEIEAIMV